MAAEAAERGRNHCIPTEIYTDVVKARVQHEGCVVRKIRVFKDVEEIDFCTAEVARARVETKENSWVVSALFKVVVGFDPGHHERVVKTIAFYKARIPFPHTSTTPDRSLDFHKLESKLKIDDLECYATVAEDEHVIVAELRFKVIVFALEDDVITVCRLHSHDAG